MYWSDPIITTDHELLHASRVDTGKTVMLPARVPIGRKLPTLVQCRIYHLDTGATIAIGQYEDLTIIFVDVEEEMVDAHSCREYADDWGYCTWCGRIIPGTNANYTEHGYDPPDTF